MRYVQRDASGKLVAHFSHEHPYAREAVPDDHPDIVAWQAHRRARKVTMGDVVRELQQRIATLEAKR